MNSARQKQLGSYYTPREVVESLVSWAVRSPSDRLLDPSCGDGRFLATHPTSVGVENDPMAVQKVALVAPHVLIHQGDFFAWASQTPQRFHCVVGNPPFIRYQRFTGDVRNRAIRLCAANGATFTCLTSSWAPFIVAASTLLERGGRMAFVVPAEIGHAPYAQPVLRHLVARFDWVQILAVKRKLFPDLSEDCWLLYCDGFGGKTDRIALSLVDTFRFRARPPKPDVQVPLPEWRQWGCRLRPFLLPANIRSMYLAALDAPGCFRLSDVARVGIGYVTGANDFFHLKPSQARRIQIPERFLHPAVRNGRCLVGKAITESTVQTWMRRDEQMLLLRIGRDEPLPEVVRMYLNSADGEAARESYKCRNRKPWYTVPDVRVPHAFLSYMTGGTPALVANNAKCVATNSVHVVTLNGKVRLPELRRRWNQPLTQLSCELEGHPLGGGMLKLEPREAGRILLSPADRQSRSEQELVAEGLATLRTWRHEEDPA